MADPRLATALDRIDRALDRLEAERRAAATLASRHERLRAATSDAIADLDRVIGKRVA